MIRGLTSQAERKPDITPHSEFSIPFDFALATSVWRYRDIGAERRILGAQSVQGTAGRKQNCCTFAGAETTGRASVRGRFAPKAAIRAEANAASIVDYRVVKYLLPRCEVLHICRAQQGLSVADPVFGRHRCHRPIQRTEHCRCLSHQPHREAAIHAVTWPAASGAALRRRNGKPDLRSARCVPVRIAASISPPLRARGLQNYDKRIVPFPTQQCAAGIWDEALTSGVREDCSEQTQARVSRLTTDERRPSGSTTSGNIDSKVRAK